MVAAEEKSHWKEMVQPAKAKSQKRSDSEAEKGPQLSCNFLTCAGSILSEIGFEIDCPSFLFLLTGAVKTCLRTGSAEEVIDCVKNISARETARPAFVTLSSSFVKPEI